MTASADGSFQTELLLLSFEPAKGKRGEDSGAWVSKVRLLRVRPDGFRSLSLPLGYGAI